VSQLAAYHCFERRFCGVLVVYECVSYEQYVRSWESGSKGSAIWQQQEFYQPKIMSQS
jgi:hypothetical protein